MFFLYFEFISFIFLLSLYFSLFQQFMILWDTSRDACKTDLRNLYTNIKMRYLAENLEVSDPHYQ